MWCVLNLILLIAALLVGYEKPQMRKEHRLQRCLSVKISTYDQTIIGETVNISEAGALIAVDSQLNLPDEIEIEVMGDYGAKVSLTARVVRLSVISKMRKHMAIHFVNLTQIQKDELSLVLYSDVEEWYSQQRKYVDKPISSFGFLATSSLRSLRNIQPAKQEQIRKQVLAFGELYLDGDRFTGTVTNLGIRGLRLKLDSTKAKSSDKILKKDDLYNMQITKPPVGLILSKELDNQINSRFIAEIVTVEEDKTGKINIELKFPDKFKDKQQSKIKQILQQL